MPSAEPEESEDDLRGTDLNECYWYLLGIQTGCGHVEDGVTLSHYDSLP